MAASADRELIDLVIGQYSKSSAARLQGMIDALRLIESEGISGDIVECGVWRGGNIILARKLCPDRDCWLYDTFNGMTEPGRFDRKPHGPLALHKYKRKAGEPWMAASLSEVKKAFFDTGTFDETRLNFMVGPVERTLVQYSPPREIALLRLDTDWYSSTKIELEKLYPNLVSGGILIVDDYGHWLGARKAVDDYFGAGLKMQWLDETAIQIRKQ